ncbi:MAG: HlyD family type I secretion periplasmic adaptor subunit [Gammaproteobacteria bacterium]|nr:HlyD family type I secretion periplasmic adaptor subunit [Gammaproteobacteria bacterium]
MSQLNRNRGRAVDDELEFLPAALELQQRPPSPVGRAISWCLMLFFTTAVSWAVLGEADIVAVAQGRIIPNGHSKVIQPLESGRIKAIHVREGDPVLPGDPLIELEDEAVRADLQRIEEEIASLEQEHQRLDLLGSWLEQGGEADPASASPERLTALQQQLLLAQWQAHRAQLQRLYAERRSSEAERESLRQQVSKLEATLPLVTKRAETLQRLVQKKFLGESEYLEMEQQRLEQAHDLQSLRKRGEEMVGKIAEIDASLELAGRTLRRQLLLERQENRKRVAALRQERIKASARLQACILSAPIAGVVQQLGVHTLGGIVTPAQMLLSITPNQQALEVEALVENRDIGFLRTGQHAEVKVDAFPYTRYGVIDAVLSHLSSDALNDERQGLVYRARITLSKSRIQVDGNWVELAPGMRVTAEVKTGKRRLIEFFLAPLLRYRSESIRER